MIIAVYRAQIQLLVYRALSHYLLLPWTGATDAEQLWESRAAFHAAFLAKFTQEFLNLKAVQNFAQNKQLQEQGTVSS